MARLPFRDREEAGRRLGAELASRGISPNTVVLALPRGGVQVGSAVAKTLHAPLDVIMVRKLGVPGQPELAMGALSGDSQVLDPQIIRELGITQDAIEMVTARERQEIVRGEKLYRGDRRPLDLRGQTILLVDDGLATGLTMKAAVRYARLLEPRALIVAVPVGSSQACERVSAEADGCVCLAQPEAFGCVGQWYLDFRQVSDAEVRGALAEECSAKYLMS